MNDDDGAHFKAIILKLRITNYLEISNVLFKIL